MALFTTEAVLKITALGVKAYWRVRTITRPVLSDMIGHSSNQDQCKQSKHCRYPALLLAGQLEPV